MDVLPKEEMFKILDSLPESVTWDEIIEEINIKKSISKGLKDYKNGNIEDNFLVMEEAKKYLKNED